MEMAAGFFGFVQWPGHRLDERGSLTKARFFPIIQVVWAGSEDRVASCTIGKGKIYRADGDWRSSLLLYRTGVNEVCWYTSTLLYCMVWCV